MQFLVNKNQNGYFAPDEFNMVINEAQTMYMSFLIGDVEQYQNGRPVPRVQYGMNETVRQKITPFIGPPLALTVDSTGLSIYPTDYVYPDTVYDSNFKKIRYVQQNFLSAYINSSIDPIATNPICLIQSNGIQFYPVTITAPKLSYVRKPKTIVWDSIDDSNGRPVYNAGTSTDPEWADDTMIEIISRALRMVGVNLEDTSVSQYANEIKQTGS